MRLFRRWLRWLGVAVALVLVGATATLSVVMLRDPAMRGLPLGAPTPWPTIILEEAAAPSAPRWEALARREPPPPPARACVLPSPRVLVPTFGDVRYCGRARGQISCPRGSLGTPGRAQACAVHATRVAEALLRRGDAEAAWAWFREARILLGIGAGLATDPAVALELNLRIRQLDLDLGRWLPWLPVEEALQATVAAMPGAVDSTMLRAVRDADWPVVARQLASAELPGVWRTDSVAVAILARAWRGTTDTTVALGRCPGDGHFWRPICDGEVTRRSDRDPLVLTLDVAREDARGYRRAQRQRVDSLLAVWSERQPALVPRRLLVIGSEARLGRFLLERMGANGLAVPWPRTVVIDVGRGLDRVASTLAHELGHHAQFRARGVRETLRMGAVLREAEADAWGRAFLCRVGGPRLGRLGGRCPEIPSE